MKALTRTLALMFLAAALASAQIARSYGGTPLGFVPLPSSGTGGAPGGAGNPANLTVFTADVPDALLVNSATVQVYLAHPRVADLTITLSHCGVTATIFSGAINQVASAGGIYGFSDLASTTFTSAVNLAQGAVAQGVYKPLQSFSGFAGQSAAGPWTLTIADLAAGVSGQASNMLATAICGASFGGLVSPAAAIPDGAGGCVAPLSRVVNVPTAGQVGLVYASLGLVHTFTSDLTIVLSHAGVTATLIASHTPQSGADLNGVYTFTDEAVSSWTAGVAGTPSNATVPPTYYRPLVPLSVFRGLDQAGPWYVTICDDTSFDTGTLTQFSLQIQPETWDLQILQPNGPASVTLVNTGGANGHSFANLMTLAPGGYPNGWLHGLDIAFEQIVFELSLGGPFFGSMDACGSAVTNVPGPIPSGLTVYVTSLDLDSSGGVVTFKKAFAYTTP